MTVAEVPIDLTGRGWLDRAQVLAGEVHADHGTGATAIGGSVQHLQARIPDVPRRVHAADHGHPGGIRLQVIACTRRVRGRMEAEGGERLDPRPESRADHHEGQRVHPGHDWLYVLDGRLRLLLGEREILLGPGEAAEFSTMTPHALAAMDGPAEVIMIIDRDGRRAHTHAVET